MNEERKLQKVKINIARSPLFAAMHGGIMTGTTRICDKAPTAYTDGYNEVYGRVLVKHLPEKQLAFVVAHENMHKLKRDLTTYRRLVEIDARCANMATDHVINLSLIALDPTETVIAMPRHWDGPEKGKPIGLADKRFAGMDVMTVFRILRQEQEEQEEQSGQSGQSGQNGQPGFDEHDWEAANGRDIETEEKVSKEIDQAVREGLLAAERFKGVGGGDLARELGELTRPRVDWRQVLREFVKATCAGRDKSTWRKPNRRLIGEDVYMPSLISERVNSIVVGVDTSGSIRGKELNDFLSEIQGIAEEVQPHTVELLYWDSRVAAHETYTDGAVALIAQSTKPVGGGGTAPSCVSTYVKEKNLKPECIVMFTDGHVGSDWGSGWSAPVLWVVLNNKSAVATNGTTVHIEGGV